MSEILNGVNAPQEQVVDVQTEVVEIGAVDTDVVDTETIDVTDQSQQPKQSAEDNAKYASIRRKAEEEMQLKLAQEKQNAIDAFVAKQYDGYTDPRYTDTPIPITTEKQLQEILEFQRMQTEAEEKGIDVEVLQQKAEADKKLQEYEERNKALESLLIQNLIKEDFAEYKQFDTTYSGDMSEFAEMYDKLSRAGLSKEDSFAFIKSKQKVAPPETGGITTGGTKPQVKPPPTFF